jgi:hypothetical protein
MFPDQITPSGRIVESHLDECLEKVQGQFRSEALAFFGPLYYGAEDNIRDAVEFSQGALKGKKAPGIVRRPKLSVILETPGGYIQVAERIANVLHKHFDFVEFIVPDYAMSAGTVLVMSGNDIWMDYFSILGPIDPQIEIAERKFGPAHGYLIQYQRLIDKSRRGKITTAELQFLIEKFNPAELHQYEQEMQLSVTLLKEWLVHYKFKGWNTTEASGKTVTDRMKRKRAEEIAQHLNDTKRWHSHSRGISMEVLRRDVKLKINDFGEKDCVSNCIRVYHKLMRDYLGKLGTPGAVHVMGNFSPMIPYRR